MTTRKPTDKERLDWLFKHGFDLCMTANGQKKWYINVPTSAFGALPRYYSTPRAAIDAAIKAEGKGEK